MTASTYSIHPASEEERLAAYRNVHEVWGQGLPLAEFLERRLYSPRHNRAGWWVLTVGGQVVSSLGCHPLEFAYDGRGVQGFGIGSVHTLAVHRRRGYAAALCHEVAQAVANQGAELGLLFSDITPAYYEKLGYRVCPAWKHRCRRVAELAESGPRAFLEQVDPVEKLAELATHYQNSHASDRVYVRRSEEYWTYSLKSNPSQEFFMVCRAGGARAGYIRVAARLGELELVEVALPPDADELEQAVYRAAAALVLERNQSCLTGWLRQTSAVEEWITRTARTDAIPMLCSVSDDVSVEGCFEQCHFWRSDHF